MTLSISPRKISANIDLGTASAAILYTSEDAMRARRIRTKGHDIEASKYKDECGFALHRLKPSVYATNDEWFEKDLPPL